MINDLYLGIDVGGTLIKTGIVDKNGNIVFFSESETPNTTPEQLINYLGYLSELTLKESGVPDVAACGVGFPGLVDPESGIVSKAPNLPKWKPINVQKVLEKWLKRPVYIGNDANLAIFAECIWGNAVDFDYVLGITLGTGVGGGIVLEKVLYTGSRHMAGEIGHITVDPMGPRCKCGKRGCLETYAGSEGIVETALEIMKKERGSILWTADPLTPESIHKAAIAEDRAALLTLETLARHLALGLSSACELINPDIIIIGGGVSRFGDSLLLPLKRAMKRTRMLSSMPVIDLARHIEKSGVLGAASLAMIETEYTREE